MKILPFVHRSFPVMLPDGTLVEVPVQTMRTKDGTTLIRIGFTVMRLDESGRLQGYEMRIPTASAPDDTSAAAHAQSKAQEAEDLYREGLGQPPGEPIFPEGFGSYAQERAGWQPGGSANVPFDHGQFYTKKHMVKKGSSN